MRAQREVTPSVLILSAFEPELGPLRAALARVPTWRSAVGCLPAGIGAIDAAVGASRAITERTPGFVLFIGTAGTYGDASHLGDVAVARNIFLGSTAAVRGDGYLPTPMITHAETDKALRRALLKSATRSVTFVADVVTPLAITKSAALGARLAKATGAGVENLEVFAIARAAATLGVPFGAVLGISNRVGPQAHTQWLRHREPATVAASETITAFLASLYGPRKPT